MTDEFWQTPTRWPHDLSGQNMFLLDFLSKLGPLFNGKWNDIPGFYKVKGPPLPLPLANAHYEDLARADKILCDTDFDYQPTYKQTWVSTPKGSVAALCPILTEGELFQASMAPLLGVDRRSEQSKLFIEVVTAITVAIVRGSLKSTMQSAGATTFELIPGNLWNVQFDAILARFAFGEMRLSDPRSVHPRGPDRLFVDLDSANRFLRLKGLALTRTALVQHFEGKRAETRTKDDNTFDRLLKNLPEEFKSVFSRNAAYEAFKEAGHNVGPIATLGGPPRIDKPKRPRKVPAAAEE
jgi:hypothetical protein